MNIRNIMFPDSGYRSQLLQYRTVYLLLALTALLCYVAHPCGVLSNDSGSYYRAAFRLTQLRIDEFRPPVYPLLILATEKIADTAVSRFLITLFQWLLFGAAVLSFRRCAAMLGGRRRPVFWATVLFALVPGMWRWNYLILTESVSISLSVFLITAWVSATLRPAAWKLMAVSLLIVVLFLTRPVFLALVPVYALWLAVMLLRCKALRRMLLVYGTDTLMAMVITVGSYWAWIHHIYDLDSVSVVSMYNNYMAVRQAGLVRPGSSELPELNAAIDRYVDQSRHIDCEIDENRNLTWVEIDSLVAAVGQAAMSRYVSGQMKRCPREMAMHYISKAYKQLPLYPVVLTMPGMRRPPFPLNMNSVFYVLAAVAVLMAMAWRKRKPFPLATATVWACCAVLYLAVILGAMDDYTRLFAPAYPMLLLLLLQLISFVGLRRDSFDRL